MKKRVKQKTKGKMHIFERQQSFNLVLSKWFYEYNVASVKVASAASLVSHTTFFLETAAPLLLVLPIRILSWSIYQRDKGGCPLPSVKSYAPN